MINQGVRQHINKIAGKDTRFCVYTRGYEIPDIGRENETSSCASGSLRYMDRQKVEGVMLILGPEY